MKKLIYAMLWIGLLSTPLQADGSARNMSNNTDVALNASASTSQTVCAFNTVKGETR